jgi:antitoxin CptB
MNEPGKLQWQCRRGLLELDLLLSNYLQSDYRTASPEERAQFASLLKLDDSELLAVMLKKNRAKK